MVAVDERRDGDTELLDRVEDPAVDELTLEGPIDAFRDSVCPGLLDDGEAGREAVAHVVDRRAEIAVVDRFRVDRPEPLDVAPEETRVRVLAHQRREKSLNTRPDSPRPADDGDRKRHSTPRNDREAY